MNILFVSWMYYPVSTATGSCIQSIMEEMAAAGEHVAVLSFSGDTNKNKEVHTNQGIIYNVFDAKDFNIKDIKMPKKYVEKFIILYRKLGYWLRKKIFLTDIDSGSVKLVIKSLEQIADKYDVIIPVCSHAYIGVACAQYCEKMGKRMVLYQVDPIASNVAYRNKAKMKEIEDKIYGIADLVVTTPLIALEKKTNEKGNISKLLPLEFPDVHPVKSSKESSTTHKDIVSFFAGRFYNGVRDCEYLLKLYSAIQNDRLTLLFAGSGQEEKIQRYMDLGLEGRIKHLGKICLADCFKQMMEADILLNIGNTTMNQVPSKIFEYISTGKPIISIETNEKSPSIPYLRRYPLALIIVEGQEPIVDQAKKVESFILNNYKHSVDYSEIDKEFKENTSEYVSGKILEQLYKLCCND